MTKILIKMNDGSTQTVEVENYDAEEIAERLNNNQNNMCGIGSGASAIVCQRYSVIRITPVDLVDDSDDEVSDS